MHVRRPFVALTCLNHSKRKVNSYQLVYSHIVSSTGANLPFSALLSGDVLVAQVADAAMLPETSSQ